MRTGMIVFGLLAILMTGASCDPPEKKIANTIQEMSQGIAMSMLSQVNWQQIMANVHGRIGPDTQIVVEAYVKHVAGIEMRFRGAELEMNMQGSGTGGQDNSKLESWPEVVGVQTWWENEVSKGRANRAELQKRLSDAIIRHYEATHPATTTKDVPVNP